MRRPAKKANSREAFAAVFEEQTRRFSAFDLLGLSPEAPSPSPGPEAKSAWPAKDDLVSKSAKNSGHTPTLRPDRQVQAQRPDGQAEAFRQDRQGEVVGPDRQVQAQRPDGQAEALVQYGLTQALTVDPQYLGLTVGSSLGLTPSLLGPDRLAQAEPSTKEAVLLAPLQWAVWLALQNAEAAARTISYRQIAQETKATLDGVKKAVNIIQREGGIVRKEIVRTAAEQGFRVTLSRSVAFRRVTLNEAKGVLKRGASLGLIGGGEVQVLGPDGLRMYVCNNIYIQQTDLAQLLRLAPPEWKIREQTLTQIAEALPQMTAIEFRLSLAYLIEQAKGAKEPIRNPNAWLKAAFEKNGGPLVTEREIEARFEQPAVKKESPKPRVTEDSTNDELELLRRYLAGRPEDRDEIDRLAEEKAAPLLTVVSEDKRPGIIEEARREAIREFFFRRQ